MFIKHLQGSKNGTIEDLPYESAKRMVEAGHAEDVYHQLNLPRPCADVIELPTPTTVSKPDVLNSRAETIEIGSKGIRRRK